MAECGTEVNSGCDTDVDTQGKETSQGPKRGSSISPSSPPPQKSPRIQSPTSSTLLSEAAEKQMALSRGEEQNPEGGVQGDGPSLSPSSRRKSWRRSARGRRSLPALHHPSQALCCSVDPSLPEEERLNKLLEASLRLALQKTKNSLQTLPNACLESFQNQMESILKEWCCLAKDISSKPECQQPLSSTDRDPAIQKAIEQTQKAIHRLQVENASWESLLNKHRSKADELARRVEQAQQGGVPLDPACLSQSSQSRIILSKPDYQRVLSRQQPLLHTVELVMDSQCKMVRELLSIQGQAKLQVKETSSQLASEAGFQHLPSDPIRSLLAGPVPTLLS